MGCRNPQDKGVFSRLAAIKVTFSKKKENKKVFRYSLEDKCTEFPVHIQFSFSQWL